MSIIFPKIKPRKKRAIVLGNKRVKKKKRYNNNNYNNNRNNRRQLDKTIDKSFISNNKLQQNSWVNQLEATPAVSKDGIDNSWFTQTYPTKINNNNNNNIDKNIIRKTILRKKGDDDKHRNYNEHGMNNPWFSDIQDIVQPDPVYLEDLNIHQVDKKKTDINNASMFSANTAANDTNEYASNNLAKQNKVGFVQIKPRRYTRRPYIKGKYILRKVDDVNLPLPRPTNMNVLLWHSAANGDKQGCRDAIVNGASLNWRNEVFSDDKYTPFLIAVRNGHMHCIRFICEECLNFDLKQMTAKGRDGFLEACLHGRLEVLKYYYKNYKHEIDLKAKDRSGNTALTLSNKSKNKQVKRFIIKLLKQDHKRSKRLLGNATSNSRSKYQRNLAVAYTLYS